MQIGFKYHNCRRFGNLYEYGYKYTHIITKEVKQRLKILNFWRQYGLKAATAAFEAKRSTLYGWWKIKIYVESEYKVESLNPGRQAKKSNNKREIHPLISTEIKRLGLDFCPNMGKAKVKKYLGVFSRENNLPIYSESKIGRIIKDKKIYHQRQKVYHNRRVKTAKREKKLPKPGNFKTRQPADLVEIDTVVKFVWGVKRYIITAVDVHSRYSFAFDYERALSANARDFYKKLETVFPYRIKAAQTDNGSEFHKYFREYLKEQKIIHYWNYPGKPYKQRIKKYNRTIQEEFIAQNEILLENINSFNQELTDWLIWYNTNRYHCSLNLETPLDYLIKNNLVSKMRWTNTIKNSINKIALFEYSTRGYPS